MKNQIKQLKDRLECYIALTRELEPIPQLMISNTLICNGNSKEIEKAIDSLYLAKCWVDTIITHLEDDIEDEAKCNFKTVIDSEFYNQLPYSQKLAWFIIQIKECLSVDTNITIYQHLSEAIFWLEAEIDRYTKTL